MDTWFSCPFSEEEALKLDFEIFEIIGFVKIHAGMRHCNWRQ